MAANSNEYTVIAQSNTFRARVQLYMHAAAHAVYAEGAVAGHAERLVLADQILAGSQDVQLWAYSVMTNSTAQAAGDLGALDGLAGISDNDLSFIVQTSIYNSFAGIE